MWFLVTRNRPDDCQALIDAMVALGDVPEVAVMIDRGTAEYGSVRWPDHWSIHWSEEHLEFSRATNALLSLYPDRATYGLLADHARPKTKGWNTALEIAASDWNVAYCEDGYLRGRRQDEPWRPHLSGSVCLGGNLVRALGWITLPSLVHLYVDDALEHIGDTLGLMRFLPNVRIETVRAEVSGRPMDENRQRLYRGQPFAEADRNEFATWRDTEAPALIDRIAASRNVDPLAPVVTFACVKVGDRYDAKWVNILLDMVKRHVPEGYKFDFACVTDDPDGLDPGIKVIFADPSLSGWWAKLQLFSPRVFSAGQRIIYFDLDTLILDNLDELLSYRGPLAALRDFYRPDGLGSGVMLWGVGEGETDIWNDWELSGRPQPEGGDQAWLEAVRPATIRLQDVFPGKFVSYKVDCRLTIPEGAAVCCFHGFPKNDEAPEAWVKEVWKIGGVGRTKALVTLNTTDAVIFDNIREASARELPWVKKMGAHSTVALLVGGGASLKGSIDMIRAMAAHGAHIFALNGAARYLRENGVAPKFLVVIDPRPANARFIEGDPAEIYLLASQCAPEIIDAALRQNAGIWDAPRNVQLFHLAIPGAKAITPTADFCWCSTTVGLTAMGLVHMMGYRTQHLFGYDSSYHDGNLHAYEQTLTEQEGRRIEVWGAGRTFTTSPVMLKQTEEFQNISSALADAGATIAVHGDGLLPHVARELSRMREASTLENAA